MKKNITIKEFVTAIKFNLGDGFEYGWNCYGENSYSIGWMKADRTATASIVYDIANQKVYQMEVWDELNSRVYRWIDPRYAKAHANEARKLGVNDSIAMDRVRYEELAPSKIMKILKTIYSRRKNKNFMRRFSGR
jgi:hypothetical protein